MNAGQERKKKKWKFPALYENIPQVPTLFIIYTHLPQLPLHCINNLQLKHCRRVSLERRDSEINKAEHGYNIGTHAVNKHPVNNILRLNKVFL